MGGKVWWGIPITDKLIGIGGGIGREKSEKSRLEMGARQGSGQLRSSGGLGSAKGEALAADSDEIDAELIAREK